MLYDGNYQAFFIILAALIFSLCLHQYFWALAATWMGDDTPARAGRVTLDPMVHIDMIGLLMVVLIGFGYPKPVPTEPSNFRHSWGAAFVAAAAIFAYILIAVVSINAYFWLTSTGVVAPTSTAAISLAVLSQLSLLLAVFNLLPIGQLDGHHIVAWLLPSWASRRYVEMNSKYGLYILLALVALNFLGVPVFKSLMEFAERMVPYLIFV